MRKVMKEHIEISFPSEISNLTSLEIDLQAVEVKWTDRYYERPTELTSLKYFMDKNNMDYAMVTSMTQLGVKKLGERRLQFIPMACYAYTVAENTLRQAKYSYGLQYGFSIKQIQICLIGCVGLDPC